MVYLIIFSLFITFTALGYYFFYNLFKPKELKKARAIKGKSDEEIKSKKELGIATKIGKFIAPKRYSQYLRRQLDYAGIPRDLDVNSILSLKIIIAGACLLFFLITFITTPSKGRLLMVLIIPLAAFFLPDFWLMNKAEKRQKQISLDLPDTIDLLTVSVEAGRSVDAAIKELVDNAVGPLIDELSRLNKEMRLGLSRRQAFHNLADRTRAPELGYFVMSIMQADTYGISIGKVLREQSRAMKLKRRQKAEEIAMKTPVKIIFPLLLCIFPALLIIIIGPAGIRIAETFSKISP